VPDHVVWARAEACSVWMVSSVNASSAGGMTVARGMQSNNPTNTNADQ
jgi:hypothetical protein